MAKIDFSEIRDRMMGTLDNVADKARDFASVATDKAKQAARIAKLSTEISSERDNMRKVYVEIGKLYYANHKDDEEGLFAQLCEEVTLAKESIAVREAEIAELKRTIRSSDSDDGIEVEFEEVVSGDEAAADDSADCDCEVPAPAAEPVSEPENEQ